MKSAINQGLMLTAFIYRNRRYRLTRPYPLVGIVKKAEQFEGEEQFRGYVQLENGVQEVTFYIDAERMVIPYLWDTDGDGVQYDPNESTLFWEWRDDKDIMGPLDDFEFQLIEDMSEY